MSSSSRGCRRSSATLLFAATLFRVLHFLAAFPAAAHSHDSNADVAGFDPFQTLGFVPGLEKRQNEIVRGLGNDKPGTYNLEFGQTNYWVLESAQLFIDNVDGSNEGARGRELKKRQEGQTTKKVYITFNTCLQPVGGQSNDGGLDDGSGIRSRLPQLQVFVSNNSGNQAPGPGVLDRPQTSIPIVQGFGNLTINASGPVWVGVFAPDVEDWRLWKGVWSYELVLSTRKPYHGYIDDQFLYLVDSDNDAALLITGNMTKESANEGGVDEEFQEEDLMTRPPPYTMYAQNQAITSRFLGLERSYCAVTKLAQVRPRNLDMSMTRRGFGHLPKQQFHLKELNRSSSYLGYLARPNSTDPSDTSGTLWRSLRIKTKQDGNCQIIYNLPFCSEVAYAVPSNPTLFLMDNLTAFYDEIARGWYKNFTYSLQQVQCNASSSAQYSLARNCTDCDAAYKNWLCAVTIPRCMDYSSDLPYLAERATGKLFFNASSGKEQPHAYNTSDATAPNVTDVSSSRNPKIDEVIRPGPYKEVKPCVDLCWSLVQSCPSSFGFQCPLVGSWGVGQSYGDRDLEGDVTCSFLGAVYFLSGAPGRWSWWGGGGGLIVWGMGMIAWFSWVGV